MTDTEPLDTAFNRYLQCLRSCRSTNLKTLTQSLSAHGVAKVTIAFDGYGDQGQTEAPTLEDGEGNPVAPPNTTLPISTTASADGEAPRQAKSLNEALEDFAYDALAELCMGWQDNEGSFGTITINVAENCASLELNARFTDHHTTTIEL